MQVIIEAVKTIGISAVFVLIMAYFVKYMFDKFMKMVDDLNSRHNVQIAQLTEVINNNTIAIQKLSDRIESDTIYVTEE